MPKTSTHDDFTRIRGISSRTAAKLCAAQILTFADLASLSPAELSARLRPGTAISAETIEKKGWLAQAAFLGRPPSISVELIAVASVLVYSFVMSFIIMKLLDWIMGVRVSADDERDGLDLTQHGEQVA